MKIKTRFAPSPTGHLHVGGVRTALYCWLLSRHAGGEFILRIEDTDLERSSQKAIDEIIAGMTWLNLDWDKGPYFQTKRFERYNAVIEDMLIKGAAYRCYCSKLRLHTLREKQIANGEKLRYDGYCRDKQYIYKNYKPHVVRFCNPREGSVIFHDKIRGRIEFSNRELDDLIIRRTDGSPTYNFCVVVDDWDMEITHIIRGEEHINNTPRQINLLRILGAPVPEYAHVSMILGDNGKKLSKRHGAVGVMEYRDNGYLPQALLNYLVRLGWSHGDQEIFSLDDMKTLFNLDELNKSSSVFNTKKLQWLNHHYINHLPSEEVAEYLAWHVEQLGIDTQNGPELKDIVILLRKRCNTLREMAKSCHYFYADFQHFDSNSANKYLRSTAHHPLISVRAKLASINLWTPENIYCAIQETANELGCRIEKVNMPLRVAVTGVDRSPGMDVTVYAIGQARSLKRIDRALIYIYEREVQCSAPVI